jgi:hypothetical protein
MSVENRSKKLREICDLLAYYIYKEPHEIVIEYLLHTETEECFNYTFTLLFGVFHNVRDKPAIYSDEKKAWYKYGIQHREGDKPSYIDNIATKWHKNGMLHRDGDKPAVIIPKWHAKKWYKEGQLYRESGKSVIEFTQPPSYSDIIANTYTNTGMISMKSAISITNNMDLLRCFPISK